MFLWFKMTFFMLIAYNINCIVSINKRVKQKKKENTVGVLGKNITEKYV